LLAKFGLSSPARLVQIIMIDIVISLVKLTLICADGWNKEIVQFLVDKL
jgi:hypothetical protein